MLAVAAAWLVFSSCAAAQSPFGISLAGPVSVPLGREREIIGINLNLLHGVAKSVIGIEVGLINVIREQGRVLQVGGLYNEANHDFTGIQIAGGINTTDGSTYALHVAGLYNKHEKGAAHGLQLAVANHIASTASFHGLQIAALANGPMGDFTGIQLSFLFNTTGVILPTETSSGLLYCGVFTRGLQIAPFNFTAGLRGMQLGAVNGAFEDVSGLQLAALINFAKDVSGLQLATLLNAAEDVDGVQIGIFNVARRLTGLQIGAINVAYGNAFPFFPGINMGF